jgi:hypothetical protein
MTPEQRTELAALQVRLAFSINTHSRFVQPKHGYEHINEDILAELGDVSNKIRALLDRKDEEPTTEGEMQRAGYIGHPPDGTIKPPPPPAPPAPSNRLLVISLQEQVAALKSALAKAQEQHVRECREKDDIIAECGEQLAKQKNQRDAAVAAMGRIQGELESGDVENALDIVIAATEAAEKGES